MVAAYKWHAVPARSTFYAASRTGGTTVYMHRLILQLPSPANGVHVDHRDGDGLNNTRTNLRACTPAQNSRKRRTARADLGLRGVYLQRGKYIARIGHGGKFEYLGTFDTPAAAGAAYDLAAQKLFGDFAPRSNT